VICRGIESEETQICRQIGDGPRRIRTFDLGIKRRMRRFRPGSAGLEKRRY